MLCIMFIMYILYFRLKIMCNIEHRSHLTLFNINFLQNNWQDFYEILGAYRIGLGICKHIYFIPLNFLLAIISP